MERISYLVVLGVSLALIVLGCQQMQNPTGISQSEDSARGFSLAKATDSWTVLTPVPTAYPYSIGVEGMSVASIGNKIYAGFGHDIVDTPTLRIYDIASDSWSFGANGPGTSSEGAGTAHGGLFYNIGGRGAGYTSSWSYNPANDSWNVLAPMPTGRAGLAVAVVGNSIYAIGGRSNTGGPNSWGKLSVVERYDIDKDTWTTVAPLSTPRSDLAAATVGGKIYVFGGFNALGIVVNTVEVYNPVTDTWTSGLAPMPTARGGLYAVATSGGIVYVIGGWDGIYPFNPIVGSVVEAYKVSKDTWITGLTSMPTPRAETGAADHGGRIYILGGAKPGFGASVDANEAYKP